MKASVVGVHQSETHSFSKPTVGEITLVEGIGVAGDAHSGTTVQHLSRVKKNASTPNMRQVHLMHRELFEQLARDGYSVVPGDLGENITTSGVDVLALPVGTRLMIADAVITVTGLRNPCFQINDFQPGLLKKVLFTNDDGETVRLSGVMGIVSRGGVVRSGDEITVTLPPEPHYPLTPV
ncbi:MOSC domain-containing protein YiiM [Paramicrobacterium agarici]|uniref:MOSC domain-containing protein YiiM n=1 Tax=Paramicrobacterium agarici TaxID=630514 RepID=A0A2A9DY33_9MICO|nr:MOSC domain-containing protein [Microbacterium agarici]PFG31717.1 MOSC domain-containing protein YiiM [Microbacterium agarici]